MKRPASETAVVLSGGGAYGAFAVGVLKGLAAGRSPATGYEPLEADIYSGTSVGAFNAAVLVSDARGGLPAVERLESIWTDLVASRPGSCGNGIFRIRGDLEDYIEPGCYRSPVAALSRFAGDTLRFGSYFASRTANFLASSSPLENRAVGLVNIESFVDSNPLRDLLRQAVDPADIVHSPKRLRIVATNWITGEAVTFTNADFAGERGFESILASAAIPGVFQPVQVGQDLFVDGGVVQNTPLNPAIDLGATELHAIYLNPDPRFLPVQGQANTVDTMLRVYFMMLASKMSEDIETAKWINEGLDVIEGYRSGVSMTSTAATEVVRVAGEIFRFRERPYRKIVIHRYFPRYALGGDFGMLNFGRDQVLEMLAEGQRQALNHDCVENDCLLDEGNAGA